MSGLSTAHSSTYALPDGVMATYSDGSTADSGQASPDVSLDGLEPLVAGWSPSCTLSNTSPTTSSCDKTTMTAGYEATAKTTTHALIQFPETYLPQDTTVLWSELKLDIAKTSTTNHVSVGAYPVTSAWEAGATWNTTNGTTAWKSPGGDFSSGSDATIDPELGGKTGWVQWPMTQAMQEWVNGAAAPDSEGRANFGFLVKDATDGVTNNVFTFETPSEGSNAPQLVTYWISRQGAQSQFTQLPMHLTDQATLNVNAANGNLMLQNQDIHIAGRGLAFETTRTWNSMDSSLMRIDGFGMTDANDINLLNWPDGGVSFRSQSGAWFQFRKQGSTFIAPAGIAATLCTAGSPAPCPTSLPAGTAYRLVYNKTQSYIDFAPSPPESQDNEAIDYKDRYGDAITAGHREGIEHETSWTDTEGRKIESLDSEKTLDGVHVFTGMEDVSGGRTVHYEYNGSETEPLLTKYTDANGKQTKYAYNSERDLTEINDPLGKVTKLHYDGDHRITEIIRTTNSEHTTGPTTKFTYYAVGSAPSPCTSKQKGTVVKDADWTKAGAHETIYCSNTLDEVEKTVDAAGNITESSYNPFGETTETTAAAPGTGESGNVESLNYNETGTNLMCSIQGTSTPEKTCPTRPDKSALMTSYSYKDNAHPFSATRVENAENRNLTYCYSGEEQASEHPEEPACTGAGSPAGSLASERDGLSEQNELKFTYNANGTVKTSTDPDGHATSYEYDEKGNLKKIIPPGPLSPTTISVDADSRPHIITDGAGHVETITYDNDDRITKIEYTGTGTAKTVKFEYDGDGNLIKREDPTGTTKYTVDALNRLTKEELPGSVTHSYEYDAASNLTSYADGGGTTTYKYNGLNELESMTEPKSIGTDTFAYNNDHHLDKITYPSGAVESYELEPTTGRPETITAEHVTGTVVPKLTYAYKEGEDDTSLVHTLTESTGNTTTYAYDALDRLTKAVTTGTNPSFYKFKLDGAGNRLEQKVNLTKGEETGSEATFYANNADNELECRQTVSGACNASDELSAYEYDKAGDETAIAPKGDTSGATFAYNAASETSSLTPSGGSALSLAYEGTGQDGLTAIGSSTTVENSLLGITRETTSGNASYFERTPSGLLIDIRTPSGNYNPLYDAQGDIVALVSSTAKVERTFRYGPYGENVHSEGTQTIPYPFGYKGAYRMPAGNTGKGNVTNSLLHFGQRYYDPTTGRWTQQDPEDRIASAIQGDRFLFAGADPINEADPSGEGSFTAACVTAAIWCGLSNSGDQILSYPSQAAEQASAWVEKVGEYIEPTPEEEDIAEEVIEDL